MRSYLLALPILAAAGVWTLLPMSSAMSGENDIPGIVFVGAPMFDAAVDVGPEPHRGQTNVGTYHWRDGYIYPRRRRPQGGNDHGAGSARPESVRFGAGTAGRAVDATDPFDHRRRLQTGAALER